MQYFRNKQITAIVEIELWFAKQIVFIFKVRQKYCVGRGRRLAFTKASNNEK